MTSPRYKKVSHMGFFVLFHEPYHILINVLYIFARKQLTERAHHVILQGRVRVNAKTHVPYMGCMVMVCAICESCETARPSDGKRAYLQNVHVEKSLSISLFPTENIWMLNFVSSVELSLKLYFYIISIILIMIFSL